jgi:hypothetical protein
LLFGCPVAGRRGGALPAPVWVRFWTKVERGDDCWTWIGAVNDSGYGVVYDGKRLVYAHRLSYLLHGFLIPEGADVDHLCSNRLCVRPDHLEAVTHLVNVRRAWARRRNVA